MLRKKQLPKKKIEKCGKICRVPIWDIKQAGMDQSIKWISYAPNARFSVYDPLGNSSPGNPDTLTDDIVLDKETCLVWSRDANISGLMNWLDANTVCREMELAGRMGWRLPTVEELSSLIDPNQPNLALPVGHPFVKVQYGVGINAYWTSTNSENPTAAAWLVNPWRGAGVHLVGLANKTSLGYVWPVRGGNGGNNWNW